VITRVYHDIPARKYRETVISSKLESRQRTVRHSDGAVYESEFDARGLTTIVKSGNGATPKPIVELCYDGDEPQGHPNFHLNHQNSGNGNVTKGVRRRGKEMRTTSFEYDYRDRLGFTEDSGGGRIDYAYNNQNQVTNMTRTVANMTGTGKRRRLAFRANVVDVRGRVFQRQLNGFENVSPFKARDRLVERILYDSANRVIAVEPHGRVDNRRPIIKYRYDSLGRETRRLVASEDVANRELYTFSQVDTLYNEVGDPIQVTTRGRFPERALSDLGCPTTGELGDARGATGSGWSTAARVSTLAVWYDPLGRKRASADYGVTSGSFVRPGVVPNPASTPLLKYDYDAAGELESVADPLQIKTRHTFDHAGRLTRRARNLPGSLLHLLDNENLQLGDFDSLPDDATFAQYEYAANNKVRRTTVQNTHTGPQETKINFTEPLSVDLPSEVIDAQGRKLKYTYNSYGQVETVTDENGTVHEYVYDSMGRVESDRIKEYEPAKVDTSVMRIDYKYDEFGRLIRATSYAAPSEGKPDGKLVNDVLRTYGSYNELLCERQRHSDDVGVGLPKSVRHGDAKLVPDGSYTRSHHRVAYYYDYPLEAHPHFRNRLRLRTVWYPSGRWLTSEYADHVAETMGRVSSLVENKGLSIVSSHFPTKPMEYEYWGRRNVYGLDLVNTYGIVPWPREIDVVSNLDKRVSANRILVFGSLDKRGRRTLRQWKRRVDPLIVGNTTTSSLVDRRYGYDFNSNLLHQKNQQAGTLRDDLLCYDGLDRVEEHKRGTLNAARTAIVAATQRVGQEWKLDQTGNWREFTRKESAPASTLAQSRKHSRTDDILGITTTSGVAWPDPQHDAVGNMTVMPDPKSLSSAYQCSYDGWNRLTRITGLGKTVCFEYDGLGRRIVKRTWLGGAAQMPRHYYYDSSDRVLTECLEANGKFELDREYIWDVNHPERLVCRIRHRVANAPERLYALHDVLGNVVALVDEDGEVKERFLYDVQGQPVFLNPDFSVKTSQQSASDWEYLFGGMRRDNVTGLYFAGSGYYHPGLGRFLPRGPISEFNENMLNSRAEGFPFGTPQPPGLSSFERTVEWLGEQSPWIKAGIGGVLLVGSVVVVGGAIFVNPYNPYPYFMATGAILGGLQAGVEASLTGGDFGDIILGAGMGAAFGAVCPWGGVGAALGSAALGGTAAAFGADKDTIVTAFQWGGLIGGIVGSFGEAALCTSRIAARRALRVAIGQAGGAGIGGMCGYYNGRTSTAALHGATLGMMAGGIAGGLYRGKWSVRRGGVAPRGEIVGGTARHLDDIGVEFRGFQLGGSPVHTASEALEIAQAGGVRIHPSFRIAFLPDDAFEAMLRPVFGRRVRGVLGHYGPSGTVPGDVSWLRTYQTRTGNIPITIRESVLTSDEAVVGVLRHEIHEIARLRSNWRFGDPPQLRLHTTIPAEQLPGLVEVAHGTANYYARQRILMLRRRGL